MIVRIGGDVRLAVADDGAGPVVVLLHGWPVTAYHWRHTAPALVRAGYRAITVELKGLGGTSVGSGPFDKATLTYIGQQVVNHVLAEARMFMPSAVAVIGYTDTAGGADYNMALGLRRANRVRDALIAGGIPAGIITVASKGMSDPAFPTGPNKKEAKNRRVEIGMSP